MNSAIVSVQPRKKSLQIFISPVSFPLLFTHLQTGYVWINTINTGFWPTSLNHSLILVYPAWSAHFKHFTVTSGVGKPKICKGSRATHRHSFLKTALKFGNISPVPHKSFSVFQQGREALQMTPRNGKNWQLFYPWELYYWLQSSYL